MGLNPKAPAWTPGPSSSGDRRGDSLGRIRRAVHGVGTHKSVDGAETLGVGGLNLPAKKDKHRASLYGQRVQQAIEKKQIKRSRRKWKRGRAGRRLARAAARLTRERRQKAALVKVATYNVRSLSVKGANGYGRDEVVLHEAAAKNISELGIQETRRPGRTVSTAAGFRVFYSGSTQGGQHGVALLAVKESICKTSKFTREDVNKRLMSMRFDMSGQHQAVNFVAGYAPTEPSDSEKKRAFWHRLDSLVQRIPKKECFFVLMDANARTGEKIEGEGREDDGLLGAYGRDELNNNGKRLLNFATDNKLAVTNTFFSTRKGGISHTYNGVIGDRAGDFKRIDYILTRQAYRPRVHNVEVHPQPNWPIKRTRTTTWCLPS